MHCLLKAIGESALEFEVLFFVATARNSDLTAALDTVNRALLQRLATAGVALAYPTRTVHVVEA